MVIQNSNNPLQNALNKVKEQYVEGQKLINQIKEDLSKLKHDQSLMAMIKELEASGMFFGDDFQSYAKQVEAQEAQDMKALKADEAALEKLDPALESLCSTINSLIKCVNSAMDDGRVDFGLVMKDLADTTKVMSKVLVAMGEELQADLYTEAMDGSKLSTKDLQELAARAAGFAGAEGAELDSAQSELESLFQAYHNSYDWAKADYSSYNWWERTFGDGDEKRDRDKRIMANATAMMNGLADVMSAMSPALARFMPEFTAAMNVIKEVLKRVEQILSNVHMDPAKKKKEIMALVMFVLSFYQVIKQDVEDQKAKNKKDMSKGNMEASRMNIQDAQMYQKIKEEEEHNAKIMKVTMIVAEVVLGGLMMAAAPGLGTALLVAMITAMEVVGTEDPSLNATAALGKAMGSKIAADVIVGALECAFTMGAGAALDSAMASVMEDTVETAAETSLETASESIEKAAEGAASAAGKAGDKAAIKAAKEELTEIAEKAAQKAAKSAGEQFLKQPFATQVEMVLRGTFKSSMKAAMENAAKDAISTSIEDAATIAKLAARGVETSDQITDEMTTRASNQAVARASGKSFSSIAKENAKTFGEIAAARGFYTAIFATGNTDLLVDIYKKAGGDNETLLTIFQIVEQLLQMLAVMAGSGMMNGSTFEEASGNGTILRALTSLSVIPQAGEVGAAYSNSLTYKKEAKAVQGLSMTGSVADLLHAFVEQVQKDGNLEREMFLKDQQTEMASTISLASHVNDGERAGIQILVSAAG